MFDEELLDWVGIVREDDDMEEFSISKWLIVLMILDMIEISHLKTGWPYPSACRNCQAEFKGNYYCLGYGEGRNCPQAVTRLLLSKE